LRRALGIVETVGFSAAVAAMDAAAKAADVNLVGMDRVIGVNKAVGVSIHFEGEVAAVQAAVDAAVEAANRVGKVAYYKVIPRPHEELDKILNELKKNIKNIE
jgi:ethanolamine utilization protein EutM